MQEDESELNLLINDGFSGSGLFGAVVAGSLSGGGGGVGGVRLIRSAGASAQAEDHENGQEQTNKLFHGFPPLFFYINHRFIYGFIYGTSANSRS